MTRTERGALGAGTYVGSGTGTGSHARVSRAAS